MQLFPRNVIVPRSLIAPIVRVVQTRLTMNEVLSCLSWLRRVDHLGEHAEALSRLCSKQLSGFVRMGTEMLAHADAPFSQSPPPPRFQTLNPTNPTTPPGWYKVEFKHMSKFSNANI